MVPENRSNASRKCPVAATHRFDWVPYCQSTPHARRDVKFAPSLTGRGSDAAPVLHRLDHQRFQLVNVSEPTLHQIQASPPSPVAPSNFIANVPSLCTYACRRTLFRPASLPSRARTLRAAATKLRSPSSCACCSGPAAAASRDSSSHCTPRRLFAAPPSPPQASPRSRCALSVTSELRRHRRRRAFCACAGRSSASRQPSTTTSSASPPAGACVGGRRCAGLRRPDGRERDVCGRGCSATRRHEGSELAAA